MNLYYINPSPLAYSKCMFFIDISRIYDIDYQILIDKWNDDNPKDVIRPQFVDSEIMYIHLCSKLTRNKLGRINSKKYVKLLPKLKTNKIDYQSLVKKYNISYLKVLRPDIVYRAAKYNDGYLLSTLSYGSHTKIKIKCPDAICDHHIYNAVVKDLSINRQCPYCDGRGGKKVCICNSVYTTHPYLINQLCKLSNGNKKIDLKKLSAGSHVKCDWVCPDNIICDCHIWNTSINHRTHSKGTDCPFCSKNLVCIHQSLATLESTLIKEEWDYEKNTLDPCKLGRYSNEIAYWKCKYCNHKYKTRIDNKTRHRSGCKQCGATKLVKETLDVLNNKDIKYEIEKKYDDCRNKNNCYLPFDVYLTDYNTLIELDGYHHFERNVFFCKTDNDFKQQQTRDKYKNRYCQINNINLLRISESEIDNIEKHLTDFLKLVKKRTSRIELFCGKEYVLI